MTKDISHLFIIKEKIDNETREKLTKALKHALGENKTLVVFGDIEYVNLKNHERTKR